jgi:hypothetical protein
MHEDPIRRALCAVVLAVLEGKVIFHNVNGYRVLACKVLLCPGQERLCKEERWEPEQYRRPVFQPV